METISPSSFIGAPTAQMSHMRSSSRSSIDPASTRPTTRVATGHPTSPSSPTISSAPASQESTASTQSTASSTGPSLRMNSSEASQITTYSDAPLDVSSTRAPKPLNLDPTRAKTPPNAINTDCAMFSPMSIVSPISINGAKRTASGHVKNAYSISSTPTTATFAAHDRPRADSLSSSGSRASELAANLKTRLGYAMAKVQNGWEHKNINEVERLAAQRMSPNEHSISHTDQVRSPWNSAATTHAYHPLKYETPGGIPSSRSGNISPPSKRPSTHVNSLISTASTHNTVNGVPRLQPPFDVRPNHNAPRHRHHSSLSQTSVYSTLTSPPRTPLNCGQPRRPPTIRTETQTAEAERDALQALFQLGSPHASQVSRFTDASRDHSLQASPLRPRHVTFARSESSKSGDSQGSEVSGGMLGAMPETRERVTAEA